VDVRLLHLNKPVSQSVSHLLRVGRSSTVWSLWSVARRRVYKLGRFQCPSQCDRWWQFRVRPFRGYRSRELRSILAHPV